MTLNLVQAIHAAPKGLTEINKFFKNAI